MYKLLIQLREFFTHNLTEIHEKVKSNYRRVYETDHHIFYNTYFTDYELVFLNFTFAQTNRTYTGFFTSTPIH